MKSLRSTIIKLLGGYDEVQSPLVDEAFQKKVDKYIERTTKDIDLFISRHTLSSQEFDKQIVALSGGGLALTITLSKDMLARDGAVWIGLLYLSWGSFLIALTTNLISHRVSLEHYNLMVERSTYYRACAENEKDENLGQEELWEKQIGSKTRWVGGLNSGALAACLSGILFFVIFTVANKYPNYATGTSGTTSTTKSAVGNRTYQRSASHDSAPQSRPAAPASGSYSDTTNSAGHQQQTITNTKPSLYSLNMGKESADNPRPQPVRISIVQPDGGQKSSLQPTDSMTNPPRPPKAPSTDTKK